MESIGHTGKLGQQVLKCLPDSFLRWLSNMRASNPQHTLLGTSDTYVCTSTCVLRHTQEPNHAHTPHTPWQPLTCHPRARQVAVPHLPPVGWSCLAHLPHREGREAVVEVQGGAPTATPQTLLLCMRRREMGEEVAYVCVCSSSPIHVEPPSKLTWANPTCRAPPTR